MDIKTVKLALHSLNLWYDAADDQKKQNKWLVMRTKGIISHDRHLRGVYKTISSTLK